MVPINIDLNKSFLQSNSKNYIRKFLEKEKKINSDIIEIHNRPNYIKYLKNVNDKKIILYFHNDPLSMNGSITVKDRLLLLNIRQNLCQFTHVKKINKTVRRLLKMVQ